MLNVGAYVTDYFTLYAYIFNLPWILFISRVTALQSANYNNIGLQFNGSVLIVISIIFQTRNAFSQIAEIKTPNVFINKKR